MALAAISDVEAVSRPVPGEDEDRVTRLLVMVSSQVEGYIGQTFDEATETITIYPHDGVARLPHRPVTAVSAVTQGGAVLDDGLYSFTSSGYLTRTDPWYAVNGWDWCDDGWSWPGGAIPPLWAPGPLVVTYTHGGDPPADLAMVVAEVVAWKWNSDPDATSLAGESKQVVGFTHSKTYRSPSESGTAWTPSQKGILDRYRRSGFASLRLTS